MVGFDARVNMGYLLETGGSPEGGHGVGIVGTLRPRPNLENVNTQGCFGKEELVFYKTEGTKT